VPPRPRALPATSRRALPPEVDPWFLLPAVEPISGARLVDPRAARQRRRSGERLVRYRGSRGDRSTVFRSSAIGPLGGLRPGALDVAVAGRGTLVPAPVAALGSGATMSRLTVPDDARRRATYVVAGRPATVLKVARHGGEGGRSAREQTNLAAAIELVGPAHLPTPLGHGVLDGREWALESLERGVPLRRARRWWRLRHGRATLDALGRWLTELAVRSAFPVDGGVAVFQHGDLASGENVLVHRRSFVVIDWETATPTGAPLTDLLPTLAIGIARLTPTADPVEQAERVLRVCRGEGWQGAWLHGQVLEHLDRLDLPLGSAGLLAIDAWARLAAMRSQRDELLRAAGLTPPAAEMSLGERVHERWLDDPALGEDWPALATSTPRPT
jgi:hypothetical protein